MFIGIHFTPSFSCYPFSCLTLPTSLVLQYISLSLTHIHVNYYFGYVAYLQVCHFPSLFVHSPSLSVFGQCPTWSIINQPCLSWEKQKERGRERYGNYSREVREREKGEQNEEKVIITKIKSNNLYEPQIDLTILTKIPKIQSPIKERL